MNLTNNLSLLFLTVVSFGVYAVELQTSWLTVELDPTGKFCIIDKRTKITWEAAPTFASFRNLQLGTNQITFETDAVDVKGRSFPVKLMIWIEKDEVVVEVDTEDRTQKIDRFKVLPPLLPLNSTSEILLPYYGNGIAVPVAGKEFRGWSFTTFGSLDMPWVGLVSDANGYMIIWEGRSADDGTCVIEAVKTKEGELLTPSVYHEPSMGIFGYPRRVRYIFETQNGYVGLCKRYREYAKRNGFLVTLTEKAKNKPAVKLLAGAPNIWGGSPQFAREAKAAGVDRLLVNGVWDAQEIEAIKALGYLNSRYDNYEDLYTCCSQHGLPYNVGTLRDCVLKADGNRHLGWVSWDKKHTAYKRCSLLQQDVARGYISEQIRLHPNNAWFLDVTTATELLECYDMNHPHDRLQDREAKHSLGKFVSHELGLVLGGEHGRWWGVDIYDYWEGMMSINPFFTWPAGHLRPPEKKEQITDRYLQWGLGHHRRLPLWELVFHDCVVSYWYWGDSTDFLYKVAPELSDKKDVFNILYGTPPMFWVGGWVNSGFRWDIPEFRKRLLYSYRIVCKLHEQIAFEEMLSHECLTPERDVQKTVFGVAGSNTNLTEVIVNFGDSPYSIDCRKVPRQFHFKESRLILPKFGFYVYGPHIIQFRAIIDEQTVTFVYTKDYVFCDANGKFYDFGLCVTDGQITFKIEDKKLIRIFIEPGTTEVIMRPTLLVKDFDFVSARLLQVDSFSKPQVYVGFEKVDNAIRFHVPKEGSIYMLVWGKNQNDPG